MRISTAVKFCIAPLLLLSLAPRITAQGPAFEARQEAADQILKGFKLKLKETDQLLVDGKNKKAYKNASSLLREMTNRFVSGPDVDLFLGSATLLRAIAAYRLDRREEALWHWHVATQLFPELLTEELNSWEHAGAFFRSHPHPTEVSQAEYESAQNVEPPRKIRSPAPAIPLAKRGVGRIFVLVAAVIGKDGHLREPRILDAQGEPTLVATTLDTLREWEFEPALKSGQPVEVVYNLKMNFNSP